MPSEAELKTAIWDSDKREAVVVDRGLDFKMESRPFHARLFKDITAGLQYQAEGKFISFKPVGAECSGVLINDKKVAYEGAWPDCSLEVEVNKTHWKKIVRFDKPPKTLDKFVELLFEVETDFKIQEHSHYKAQLGDNSFIENAQAWDSTPREFIEDEETGEVTDTENKIVVESGFREVLGTLYYYKRIPTDWLSKAVYPVYTDTDIAWGSAVEFESGDVNSPRGVSCCAIGDDKFVIAYMDDADGDAGKAVVGTVSGTTITLGSISEFYSDVGIGYGVGVCKLDTDKFVVVYSDDASGDDGWARAATVSTRTISWGTAKEFETGDTEFLGCCQLGTDKFAIGYNDEGNSDTGTVCVCTVSGTTITSGTPATFSEGMALHWGLCKLDTDKFLGFYDDVGDSYHAKACAFTVSGTTPSAGSIVAVDESGSCYRMSAAQLDTDTAVIAWSRYSGGYSVFVAIATVSGTTINVGSSQEISGADGPSVIDVDSTHFVVAYADTANSKGCSRYCSVSGTTITLGDAEDFHGAATAPGGCVCVCALSNPSVAVCAYCDDADATDHGEAIAGTLPSTGWANIAKVNGVTATDLAKVNGIAVADIAKINGVAV